MMALDVGAAEMRIEQRGERGDAEPSLDPATAVNQLMGRQHAENAEDDAAGRAQPHRINHRQARAVPDTPRDQRDLRRHEQP